MRKEEGGRSPGPVPLLSANLGPFDGFDAGASHGRANYFRIFFDQV